MRTIAVFGATGRVGERFCAYAAAHGDSLRVLARDPSRVGAHGDNVVVVHGDVLDPDAVAQVVAGADAVVSTLGGGGTQDPGTALSQGMRHIVAAAEEAGARRLVAVGGAGVLDSPAGGLRNEQPTFPAVFQLITREHTAAWRALEGSTLDWTFVCPPDIVRGSRTGQYRVLPDFLPGGAKRISVEDVADFLLAQLGTREFVRRRVGVAY